MTCYVTVACLGLMVTAFGGEAVSPAFALDLHYDSSGEVFPCGAGTEVFNISSRWTAMTTSWATDGNNDGIPDWWERQFGLSVGGLPAQGDADGDGFSNLTEYNAGTNPFVPDMLCSMSATSTAHLVDTDGRNGTGGVSYDLNEVWGISSLFAADTAGWAKDSDSDGIPDWYEILYNLNPSVADSHADPDGDGRTNLQEYNARTNPVSFDNWSIPAAITDCAFVTDTRVWHTGIFPSAEEPFAVIMVSGGFICDTGGLYYDWDHDGIPNWWEARYAHDGSKTGLNASADDDDDGMSNHEEFVAYTDPTNQISRFTIHLEPTKKNIAKVHLMAVGSSVPISLLWQSARGRTYSVYISHDLSKGWEPQPVANLTGTGEKLEYRFSTIWPTAFFKVSVNLSDDY